MTHQKKLKLIDLSVDKEQNSAKQSKAPRGQGKNSAKQNQGLAKQSKITTEEVESKKAEIKKPAKVSPAPEKKPKIKKTKKSKKASVEKPEKAKKPKKLHSQRYQEIKAKIDPAKRYPLLEAFTILKDQSSKNFDESLELHLTMKTKSQRTEKKAPLVHKKLGKISEGEELLKILKKELSSFRVTEIRKAVLKTTMSPSIKLDFTNLEA